MRIVIYGRAYLGKALYKELSVNHEVVAFTDDYVEEESSIFGVPLLKSENICNGGCDFDEIVLASMTGLDTIRQKCLDLGIPENKIIASYAEAPLESRRRFLKALAEILNGYERDAAVAEAGVFRGEFAKWINAYFPERTLHLFDTFEGFDSRDILTEVKQSFSNAQEVTYLKDTSIRLVMDKMPHPDRVQVHKGYFPETTEGLQSSFCFANLDLDLFDPTYRGLYYFKDRMTQKGVILVHDYYWLYEEGAYMGVRPAVDRFLDELTGAAGEELVRKVPIGDGMSIMLVGDWDKVRIKTQHLGPRSQDLPEK